MVTPFCEFILLTSNYHCFHGNQEKESGVHPVCKTKYLVFEDIIKDHTWFLIRDLRSSGESGCILTNSQIYVIIDKS